MNFKLPLIAVFVAALGLTACGGGSGGSAAAPTVAVAGTFANVKYSGFVYSASAAEHKGTKFDSGQFEFKLGGGGVIPGFDAGVNGMKVGDKKTFTVTSAQGYGKNPPPGSVIPVDSDLVFDVELVSLR
jgi:FKBP-type peptidyl-prolyl cis-trans isomerase